MRLKNENFYNEEDCLIFLIKIPDFRPHFVKISR
ncbi:unknown [[Mannheimia] succiniciproducens MBEL55E]|uniref:Uncharacterized protein n=1 Tax=Mannheimia succiniciproducens (strain KCTC 0769BP / MBEL55E) TaxID=221988 RepID=Q65PX3_MANSM|nr:unknown [[Mannheimia] succiniciproducens MBEL55E]